MIPSTPVIVPVPLLVIVAELARMAPGVALVLELLIVPELVIVVAPLVFVLIRFTTPLMVPPLLLMVVGAPVRMRRLP
jgi:hypothetical protein